MGEMCDRQFKRLIIKKQSKTLEHADKQFTESKIIQNKNKPGRAF